MPIKHKYLLKYLAMNLMSTRRSNAVGIYELYFPPEENGIFFTKPIWETYNQLLLTLGIPNLTHALTFIISLRTCKVSTVWNRHHFYISTDQDPKTERSCVSKEIGVKDFNLIHKSILLDRIQGASIVKKYCSSVIGEKFFIFIIFWRHGQVEWIIN